MASAKHHKKAHAENSLESSLLKKLMEPSSTEENNSSENLFGKMIANDLAALHPLKRCLAKRDIQGVLFRYQFEGITQDTQSFSLPHRSYSPHLSSTLNTGSSMTSPSENASSFGSPTYPDMLNN